MKAHVEFAARQFHEENPHVYEKLREIALFVKSRGRLRLGIAFIFERLRWLSTMETTGDPYKLNNNHRAFYARLLMENEPELAGLFQTREQQGDPDYYERVSAANWSAPF